MSGFTIFFLMVMSFYAGFFFCLWFGRYDIPPSFRGD